MFLNTRINNTNKAQMESNCTRTKIAFLDSRKTKTNPLSIQQEPNTLLSEIIDKYPS